MQDRVELPMAPRGNGRLPHNAAQSLAPPAARQPGQQDYEEFESMTKALTDVVNQPEATRYVLGDSALGADTIGNIIDGTATEEVPHYVATTVVTTHRTFMVLFALSVFLSIVYFFYRIMFLIYVEKGVQDTTLFWQTIDFQGYKDPDDSSYNLIWSIIVMVAELGGFVLTHIGQQMFFKQDTHFKEMSSFTRHQLEQIVKKKGKLQRIHIMVCTYSEPVETVEECVQKILDSTAPCYAEKFVYIGDDGAPVPKYAEVSSKKLEMVRRFRERGYKNVFYVGDRVKLKSQLNGKSSNLNHMILNKIYPHVTKSTDVSWKDILMVMDCDHMLKPDYFQKCCAVMLNKDCAVCLVPQFFFNHVEPDCFDNTNTNFMFRLMPFYFGAGCCFITGTNVMVRARPCFMACRFDENPHAKDHSAEEEGGGHRAFFSEVLVAEDIDLGSRIHTLGYQSVFLCQVLALGEVPLPARDIWKQRSRWAKAAHLYILDKDSVFWKRQRYMSLWQKSLYCIPLILHFIIIWAEPIMFSMPAICVFANICPYGINKALWTTHFLNLVVRFLLSTWAGNWRNRRAALYAQTSSRVLFWVNVKAVLNTIMIYTGWKKAGAFKVTTKAAPPKRIGEGVEIDNHENVHADASTEEWHPNDSIAPDFWGYGHLEQSDDEAEEDVERAAAASGSIVPVSSPGQPVAEANADRTPLPMGITSAPPAAPVEKPAGFELWWIHRALSNITNKRKAFMPFEGTLDFWVLLFITVMNVLSVVAGFMFANNGVRFFTDGQFIKRPEEGQYSGGSLFSLKGDPEINLRLIATVFAMVEAAPGLLFIWYIAFYQCAPWTLKIWVPFVIGSISLLLLMIEGRVLVDTYGSYVNINTGNNAFQ